MLVAVCLALVMPLSVSASGTGTSPLGDKAALTSRDLAWASAKQAMAVELAQFSSGRVSAAAFASDVASFNTNWSSYLTAMRPPGTASPNTLQPPPQKSLTVTQYPQAYYYCGPGAVYSTLAYFGAWTSHDGEALSQDMLAGKIPAKSPYNYVGNYKYLETYARGNTPW